MKHKILLLVICFSFVSVSSVMAHPPSDIKIGFDSETKELETTVTHYVSNPDSHFIVKIHVILNGKEILGHKISHQDNNSTQLVRYRIPDAKKGDAIEVEAYCSISGKLSKELEVE